MYRFNFDEELKLLSNTMKKMQKDLDEIGQRFDNAVKNDSKLKEHIDGERLSS